MVPSWYNSPGTGAVTPRGTQTGSACGLFAVNHITAAAARLRNVPETPVHRTIFERRGMRARVGDHPGRLVQPGGSNYDFVVLHTNAQAAGVSCFPMSPADLEGGAERASVVARGRIEAIFADHVIREGTFRVVGYLLRVPDHNGHWIALVPPEREAEQHAGSALLCDSLYPQPFLLQRDEVQQLLTAAAVDGAAARQFDPYAFNANWGCFLAGIP